MFNDFSFQILICRLQITTCFLPAVPFLVPTTATLSLPSSLHRLPQQSVIDNRQSPANAQIPILAPLGPNNQQTRLQLTLTLLDRVNRQVLHFPWRDIVLAEGLLQYNCCCCRRLPLRPLAPTNPIKSEPSFSLPCLCPLLPNDFVVICRALALAISCASVPGRPLRAYHHT